MLHYSKRIRPHALIFDCLVLRLDLIGTLLSLNDHNPPLVVKLYFSGIFHAFHPRLHQFLRDLPFHRFSHFYRPSIRSQKDSTVPLSRRAIPHLKSTLIVNVTLYLETSDGRHAGNGTGHS
jgi:hypothetical protein